jgi:predicted nuclease with RNAse H fold
VGSNPTSSAKAAPARDATRPAPGRLAAGIDVGGPRKGFDLAVCELVGQGWQLRHLARHTTPAGVLAVLAAHGGPEEVLAVGIDAPEEPAAPGARLRPSELLVRRLVCGIRWTPDTRAIAANSTFYGWLIQGFALWQALRVAGFRGDQVVEVFPTAAWTRWCGPREARSRAAWSTAGLAGLPLSGLPPRTNQDQRDALAAALVAGRYGLAGRPHGPTWPIVLPDP